MVLRDENKDGIPYLYQVQIHAPLIPCSQLRGRLES
jgi:hypothetical protein